jgi:predicted ATP-binding protein involved in virulence
MKITKLHAENVHGYMLIDVSFFEDLTFLVGLNGSGKTSALRLLMALLTPNINELEAIAFSLAEVTVLDNNKEIRVTAKKSLEIIELQITSTEEILRINRTELNLFIESKHSDELSAKVRELCQSSPVFDSISKMSTPMFLGLDRRFFVPGSIIDDTDDFRRHEYMARRYWPEDSAIRSLSSIANSLVEVNYLAVTRVQEIRAKQEKLDDALRREFFKKAFEYKPGDFARMQFPSRSELEQYRQQLAKIEQNAEGIKIPLPEIQDALTHFLERMGRVVDSLEKKNAPTKDRPTSAKKSKKSESNTPITNDHFEWMINRPQADRILEHLRLLNKYIEDRNALRDPINRFTQLVNEFLTQTNKEVVVTNNGQLTIKVNKNQNDCRPISALSSGERQLLVMLAHLSFNPNLDGSGVFIVDEPELSLHIAWQEKFVDAIREANPNVQLILATHSPAIILDRVEACSSVS